MKKFVFIYFILTLLIINPVTSVAASVDKADLIISDIFTGGTFSNTVAFTMLNQGNVDVPEGTEGFTVVYLDGKFLKSYDWLDLALSYNTSFKVGRENSIDTGIILTSGKHHVTVCIDTTRTVSENSEVNNCNTQFLTAL